MADDPRRSTTTKLQRQTTPPAKTRNTSQSRRRNENQYDRRDPVQLAYGDVMCSPRPSSGRPGTPHRYFDSSYDVSFVSSRRNRSFRPIDAEATACVGDGKARDDDDDNNNNTDMAASSVLSSVGSGSCTLKVKQVVHRHVNGLCIVTAGEALEDEEEEEAAAAPTMACSSSSASSPASITSVRFVKSECDGQTVRGKKKKQKRANVGGGGGAAKEEGETEKGSASPKDVLAIATLGDGREVELLCCVWGTILEVNRRLERDYASLLSTDPLLDGYLAVILPTGPFPPPLPPPPS